MRNGTRRIVVGIDGTAGAGGALRWTIDQARSTGAEVVAVHAFDVPPPETSVGMPVSVPDLRALLEDRRRAFDLRWCAPLVGCGVPHRTVFRAGRAGPVLVDVARDTDADLVVTGRRGLSALGEILSGSVSQFLVHHSPCPVVVVPTPTV